MAYDRLIDSAFLNSGLTEIADAIRLKGDTTAALAFPSEMVAAIGAIKGGGLGVFSNAVLLVGYPSDAVCTISDGSTSYTAPQDGTGSVMFALEPGTWTASISRDGKSVSKSVTLAALGYEEILLSFELKLMPNNPEITWTAGKTNDAYELTAYANRLQYTTASGSSSTSNGAWFYSSPIDFTNFSMATVHYMIYNQGTGTSPYLRFGVGPDENGSLMSSNYYGASKSISSSSATHTLDISAKTGIQRFYVGWVRDSAATTFYVDSILLS